MSFSFTFFIFKLMQIKAKPHESVLVFLFFHPPVCKRTIHCPPLSEHHTASHERKKCAKVKNLLPLRNVLFAKRVSLFVPPKAKQSSSSLPDCFFQINIFPKDLNPKQQPQLKSNTTQKFRSSVIQLLQVLGMVQSMTVYSIAKMFTQPLYLYTASYVCKHSESMETSTALF